jgi:hypothetical protein
MLVADVDGQEHVVTDLGSPDQRAALTAALREGPGSALGAYLRRTVAAEVADAHPGGPGTAPFRLPSMPRGWRIRPAEEAGTVLLWRRSGRWRTWILGTVVVAAAMAGAGQIEHATSPLRPWVALAVVTSVVALVGLLIVDVRGVTTGLSLTTGRLVAVPVRARSGRPTGRPGTAVTSLALTAPDGRRRGRQRLVVGLGGGWSRRLHSGVRHAPVGRFAVWLAGHADLRLDGAAPLSVADIGEPGLPFQ